MSEHSVCYKNWLIDSIRKKIKDTKNPQCYCGDLLVACEGDSMLMVSEFSCSIQIKILSIISIPQGISAFAFNENSILNWGQFIQISVTMILRMLLTQSGREPIFQKPQNFFGSIVVGIVYINGISFELYSPGHSRVICWLKKIFFDALYPTHHEPLMV
jgi:hypothetical protein